MNLMTGLRRMFCRHEYVKIKDDSLDVISYDITIDYQPADQKE